MEEQKVRVNGKSQAPKAKGPGRARRSPYAQLPKDARLLVRFFELLTRDDVRYAPGGKYTSRIHKAVMRVLTPGSEEGVRFSGFPGVWYVKSQSRPALQRWYVVNIKELTCEVDTSKLVIPKGWRVSEDSFFCEDSRHHGGICWHILAATLAEAARIDQKEYPEE